MALDNSLCPDVFSAYTSDNDREQQLTTAAYIIKCDNCKVQIGETDSIRESAAGGRCDSCKAQDAAIVARATR